MPLLVHRERRFPFFHFRAPFERRKIYARPVTREESALEWVGRTLEDRWQLEGLVGLGGVAAVYRARNLATGKEGAVKILLPLHGSGHLSARQRFVREGKIANKVASAAVLEVFDGGETEDGRPFLVTKLLEGETLEAARVAAGGALSLPEVVAIGIHLLGVLEVAHAEGIVHRDIKPANLYRSRQGMVYVLDFGLARAFEERDEESPVSSMNSPLGTLGFMAPEQAQGRWDLVGPKTDLFAVAATLLKLSTGLDLYDAPDAHQRFILSTSRPVTPLEQRGAALPAALCKTLDRALSFAQRDRYDSAREFRLALEVWLQEVRGTLPPPPTELESAALARPAQPQSWQKTALIVGIGAIVGAVLAFVWFHASR